MRHAISLILIITLITGCKRPADVRMETFAKTVQQTVDSTELQAWANTVISNNPHQETFKELSTNGLPNGVQSLMTNWATLDLATLSNNEVVIYIAGSGFGHWGFAVSDPTYICSLGHTQLHWTNGIWFWTE